MCMAKGSLALNIEHSDNIDFVEMYQRFGSFEFYDDYNDAVTKAARNVVEYARKHHNFRDRTEQLKNSIIQNDTEEIDGGFSAEITVDDSPLDNFAGRRREFTQYDKAEKLAFGMKPKKGIFQRWNPDSIDRSFTKRDPVTAFNTRGIRARGNFIEEAVKKTKRKRDSSIKAVMDKYLK